jgi:proline iminopeptidase
VLLDQRNCGRSTPSAAEPDIDLSENTTDNLVADIDRLRQHLEVDRWLVLGGSWGCTLALDYAERHTENVSELVLFGVTTGRHSEFDWTFRGGLSAFFPEQWKRLRDALPDGVPDSDVPVAYHRLLFDSHPDIRERASYEWCMWESASPDWPPRTGLADRFQDPSYALAFSRVVTHYVSHNAWLEDGALLRDAGRLADIPGVLIHGRYDFQAPIGNAWELKRAYPTASLVIVEEAGHSASSEAITREIVRATDSFTL